jgi:hypothetical protein
MNEDGEIIITVDGIDYEVFDEGGSTFIIICDDDEFAEIKLSECGEYYIYEYSPEYSSLDERSGTVHINHHEGILEFFRWVIGANQ